MYNIGLRYCEHFVMDKYHCNNFGVGTHSFKEVFEYMKNDI